MKVRKLIAWFLIISLCFLFSGCRKNPENASSEMTSQTEKVKSKKNSITLLYSVADTFNPYTAKTDINRQLCRLLYEPLIKLDNEFNPVLSLAETVEVSGNKCLVKIKDLIFSDGSKVTADDVVYSANKARAEGSNYAASLYEVVSVSAADGSTVEFALSKADPYFKNLLTFPIIKSGSDSVTDSDSVLQPPIGSGRYKVSDSRQSLVINENYYGKKSQIKKINLINAPDSESVAHYVEIGAADIYYNNVSSDEIIRMSGKKIDINSNNLIYIGINQNYGVLAENALRQALSSGLDRQKLCRDSFYNNALPATGFLSPVWEPVKAVQNIQITAKNEITVENLNKIGYNSLDNGGNRVNSNGIKLQLTLLVNSENRMKVAAAQEIANQLASYGIRITVIEKTYEQFKSCLSSGNFQLFLGEVRLTDNMDISSMVTEGGSAAFGIKKAVPEVQNSEEEAEAVTEPNSVSQVVNGFYAGNNTIADVAAVLQSEMPFIPLCYKTGVLFYSDNIENVKNSSASDIYFSIESYIVV